jgi:hypothetical protein
MITVEGTIYLLLDVLEGAEVGALVDADGAGSGNEVIVLLVVVEVEAEHVIVAVKEIVIGLKRRAVAEEIAALNVVVVDEIKIEAVGKKREREGAVEKEKRRSQNHLDLDLVKKRMLRKILKLLLYLLKLNLMKKNSVKNLLTVVAVVKMVLRMVLRMLLVPLLPLLKVQFLLLRH